MKVAKAHDVNASRYQVVIPCDPVDIELAVQSRIFPMRQHLMRSSQKTLKSDRFNQSAQSVYEHNPLRSDFRWYPGWRGLNAER